MPIYDYICSQCGKVFEKRHGMTYEGSVTCPKCASEETRKLISAPASVLDWRLSESVHNSRRFRPATVNRQVHRAAGG